MDDPYKILGVSPNSSDDEIKSAYRALAKKYHPDAYANNPLADLAAEKMKDINMAYDQITKSRSGQGGYDNYGGGSYESYAQGSGRFANVREMLNAGRTSEAQSVLESVPASDRDAEWHFLKGCVLYKSGWVNEAYLEFQNAVQMDGSNMEYRQALERIKNQMSGGGFYRSSPYGGYGSGRGMNDSGCNGCDICTGLMCADCLCNGLGGC